MVNVTPNAVRKSILSQKISITLKNPPKSRGMQLPSCKNPGGATKIRRTPYLQFCWQTLPYSNTCFAPRPQGSLSPLNLPWPRRHAAVAVMTKYSVNHSIAFSVSKLVVETQLQLLVCVVSLIAQQMMSNGTIFLKKTAHAHDDVISLTSLFVEKSASYALPINWYPRRP